MAILRDRWYLQFFIPSRFGPPGKWVLCAQNIARLLLRSSSHTFVNFHKIPLSLVPWLDSQLHFSSSSRSLEFYFDYAIILTIFAREGGSFCHNNIVCCSVEQWCCNTRFQLFSSQLEARGHRIMASLSDEQAASIITLDHRRRGRLKEQWEGFTKATNTGWNLPLEFVNLLLCWIKVLLFL